MFFQTFSALFEEPCRYIDSDVLIVVDEQFADSSRCSDLLSLEFEVSLSRRSLMDATGHWIFDLNNRRHRLFLPVVIKQVRNSKRGSVQKSKCKQPSMRKLLNMLSLPTRWVRVSDGERLSFEVKCLLSTE